MDYKIKFEYKGMGQKASGIRQKVIQQQKKDGGGDTGGSGGSREFSSSLKSLNSSILKLIASNKELAKSMSGGGIGGSSRGGGSSSGGGSAGFGKVGSSIPLIGATIALAGFAVQKINQIGNAYMALAGQQKGSVGSGGFRAGQGMYLSGEMGAGMKSYASATGKFEHKSKVNKTALKIGGIFGQSASEALGQAGTFKRAGGNYAQTASMGMGSGLETQLPIMLSGMAGMMEDSIKAGVDASSMSKSLGKNLIMLTKATGTNSVDAAMGMLKSFSGVKDQLGKGKFGSLEGLYGAEANRKSLMEKMNGAGGEKYRAGLVKKGVISQSQSDAYGNMGKNATFQDLQAAGGSGAAHYLEKRNAREMGPGELTRRMFKKIRSQYGDTPEGMQRASNIFTSMGMPGGDVSFEGFWKASKMKPPGKEVSKKGAKEIETRIKGVTNSPAGGGTKQQQMREGLTLSIGGGFAKTSFALEKSMIGIITTMNKEGGITKTMNLAATSAEGLAKKFKALGGTVDAAYTWMTKPSSFLKKLDKVLLGVESKK